MKHDGTHIVHLWDTSALPFSAKLENFSVFQPTIRPLFLSSVLSYLVPICQAVETK
jgi:hypothetical protein